MKKDNPKKRMGALKPRIGFIPPIAILEEAIVMEGGADSYGPFNWNSAKIDATTYYDAIFRHLAAWYCGEDIDPKSGRPHMAHIRASAGIVIDAAANGNLIDDRPNTASAAAFIAAMTKNKP